MPSLIVMNVNVMKFGLDNELDKPNLEQNISSDNEIIQTIIDYCTCKLKLAL